MKHESKTLFALIERLKAGNSLDEYEGALTETALSRIDFSPYFWFRESRYTRSLLYGCSRFELILICWMSGQKSKIHDHADSECIMCCIEGHLQETQGAISKVENSLQFTRTALNILRPYTLTRINNKIALHEVANVHGSNSVSLHLYIPGITDFKMYNQKSRQLEQSSSVFDKCWEIVV